VLFEAKIVKLGFYWLKNFVFTNFLYMNLKQKITKPKYIVIKKANIS